MTGYVFWIYPGIYTGMTVAYILVLRAYPDIYTGMAVLWTYPGIYPGLTVVGYILWMYTGIYRCMANISTGVWPTSPGLDVHGYLPVYDQTSPGLDAHGSLPAYDQHHLVWMYTDTPEHVPW